MQRFIKNADNTVTDTKLGLIWSETLMSGKDRPHDEAREAIATLGPEWRFPTVDELFSLVDRSRHEPAINTEFFPDTKNDIYWTDEKVSWRASAVWVVYFSNGYVGSYDRLSYGCVRAVRSGQ